MFCWIFLNFLSISCLRFPQLSYYLHGVAVTSCLTFLLTFTELLTGDNKVYSWLEAGHERQQALAKMFQSLQCLLVLLHLFWMLFGSVNVLPTAILEGFLIRQGTVPVCSLHSCFTVRRVGWKKTVRTH